MSWGCQVTGLFAFGLETVEGLGLQAQWQAMRTGQVNQLASLTEVASKIVECIWAEAVAAPMGEDESKARALAAAGELHYGAGTYFSVTNEQTDDAGGSL